MDANFWHQRWKLNEIAFHEREANPLLVKYFDLLSLSNGSRVFLPLCGKTLAIHWLLSNSYCVAGSELSEIAVKQMFSELAVEPNITAIDQIRDYSADTSTSLLAIYLTCLAACSVGSMRFMTEPPW
jgi:thiopurine S-methyltransferase